MKNILLWATSLTLLACTASCVSQKKYRAALSNAEELSRRNAQLQQSLTQTQNDLQASKNDNAQLVKQIDDAMKQAASAAGMVNMTKQQLEAEQKRLWDLRRLLDQQTQAVEGLRKKMADALTGFNASELQVFIKNGKVYVSLQENLLFPSGSAVVNPKGKQALGTLAQVLNTNPDINVVVEGHTDSIPIRGRYEDNWALSTARAASIVRILTNTYQVDPVRVTASGRSQYEPLESNSTPDGRQHNRRTEIILAPRLDQLLQLLQQNPVSTAGN